LPALNAPQPKIPIAGIARGCRKAAAFISPPPKFGGSFAQVVLFLSDCGAFVRAHRGKSLRCPNVNANKARLFQKFMSIADLINVAPLAKGFPPDR
jgi:hypothetical protein